MNGRSGFRLGGGRDMSAQGITQFTAPFGWITYPQAMAMWCRRHMIEYGTTAEQLGEIAVTFRGERGRTIRAPCSASRSRMDDYMNSRMIVDPFRMLDICLETDGACAVLVTSAERARDCSASRSTSGRRLWRRPEPGRGSVRRHPLARPFAQLRQIYRRRSVAAAPAWGPQDIDIAQIYDCFTYSIIMQLEGLGFCKEGEGGPFIQGGRIARDGALPLNTAGGLLSEGYIHGLNHVIEAVQQLRGEAGPRQIADVETCLTTAGAMTCGSAMVLRN